MTPGPPDPFGAAVRDFLAGLSDATLLLRRDDGMTAPIPAGFFFQPPSELAALDTVALERCAGRVLDCGAGAGRHALALQERGLAVTAIDSSPGAVEVMSRRGVVDARLVDAFAFEGGPFDTVLLLGHTIGIVGTLDRLEGFLRHVGGLLAPGGQLLLDAVDPFATDDPANLAYHEANRRAGRYAGEVRMTLEYEGIQGPLQGWLLLDGATLADHSSRAGFACEVLARGGCDALYRLAR